MIDPGPVSVIMPLFNAERYVAEAIRSVLGQTRRPLEIIVVDDGSSDGSAAVVRGFGSEVAYCHQPNAGPGAARNLGVRRARGELLAFLDADDLWQPDKLDRQLAALRQDLGLDAVFGQVEHFYSPDLEPGARERLACPAGPLPGYLCGAMLVRRAGFERVGFFEPRWRAGEFIDWYLRAQDANLNLAMLPEVVLRRRVHARNHTVQQDATRDYLHILKASLDRRRAAT